MAGLKGNTASLRSIGKNLPTTEIAIRVASRAASALTSLAQASFDAQTTPYGDPWPPSRDGRDVDLVDSGALRAKLVFVAVGRRVRALIGVKYAKFQIGARRILPMGNQSLPASWKAAVDRITREECDRALASKVA